MFWTISTNNSNMEIGLSLLSEKHILVVFMNGDCSVVFIIEEVSKLCYTYVRFGAVTLQGGATTISST